MHVKLSERLLLSADMVSPGAVVADVGCDHAHTCIWLVQQGIATHCIGMDVRRGPLDKAAANLALYGCTDSVELRLSYGLDELAPGEADTVIIAGMGGELVRDILERDRLTGRAAQTEPAPILILQPHSHVWDVREWLVRNGYVITAENMCREDDKFYPVIRAQRPHDGTCVQDAARTDGQTGETDDGTQSDMQRPLKAACPPALDRTQIYFGPLLLAQRHPVLKEYLEIEYRKKKYLLEQIDKSNTAEASVKRAEVEGILQLVEDALARIK